MKINDVPRDSNRDSNVLHSSLPSSLPSLTHSIQVRVRVDLHGELDIGVPGDRLYDVRLRPQLHQQ